MALPSPLLQAWYPDILMKVGLIVNFHSAVAWELEQNSLVRIAD